MAANLSRHYLFAAKLSRQYRLAAKLPREAFEERLELEDGLMETGDSAALFKRVALEMKSERMAAELIGSGCSQRFNTLATFLILYGLVSDEKDK